MEKNNNEVITIKIFSSENPIDENDYVTVDDDTFLELLTNQSISYSVYKNFWYYN